LSDIIVKSTLVLGSVVFKRKEQGAGLG